MNVWNRNGTQQRFSTMKRRSFKWLYTLNLSLFHISVPFYIIFFHYYSKRDASILRPFNQINPYSIWNCWGLESCLRFAPNKNLVIKERYCICSMYELHRFICPVLGKVDNNGSRWQRNRRKSIKIGNSIWHMHHMSISQYVVSNAKAFHPFLPFSESRLAWMW